MVTLCLEQEEMLAENVQGFPILYDKELKVLKKRMLFKTLGRNLPKV